MADDNSVASLVATWVHTYGITDSRTIAAADDAFRQLPQQQAMYWMQNGPPPRNLSQLSIPPGTQTGSQAAGQVAGGVGGLLTGGGASAAGNVLSGIGGILGNPTGPGTPYPTAPPPAPPPAGPGPGTQPYPTGRGAGTVPGAIYGDPSNMLPGLGGLAGYIYGTTPGANTRVGGQPGSTGPTSSNTGRPPYYNPNAVASAEEPDIGGVPGLGTTGRQFNPATDKPRTWEEAAGFTADAMRNRGFDDDAIRAVLAVMKQESGYTGSQTGDGGASAGAFQFYSETDRGGPGGKLDGYAAYRHMMVGQARQDLFAHPMAGVDWALETYIGPILKAAQAQGKTGPDLVDAIIKGVPGVGGQNPGHQGSQYRNQYAALVGQPVPTLGNTAVSASVAAFAGRRPPPPLPRSGFTDLNELGPYIQTVNDWMNLEMADIAPDDPQAEAKQNAIITAAQEKISFAYDWAKSASEIGVAATNAKIAAGRLAIEQGQLDLNREEFGLKQEDFRWRQERSKREDYQWDQDFARATKKDELEEYWRGVGASGWITSKDPDTGEIILQPTWEREYGTATLDFQKEAARRQEQQFYVGKAVDWDTEFQRDMAHMAETQAGLYAQGFKSEQEVAPWAFMPGQEYARGFEPGGIAQKLAEMTGTAAAFQPISRDMTRTVYPYQGLEQYIASTQERRNQSNPFAAWIQNQPTAPGGP